MECRLDTDGRRAQGERWAAVGAAAERMERSGRRLVVDVRSPLVEETLRVERSCCPFFSLAYDGARLTVAVDDPAHEPALDAIEDALRARGPSPAA